MKNGFKVLDSDLHTMEPDGLWEKYLEGAVQEIAPRFTRGDRSGAQPARDQGRRPGDRPRCLAAPAERPSWARTSRRRAFARHPHYEVAHARGYDAPSPRSGHGHRGHRRGGHLRDARDGKC